MRDLFAEGASTQELIPTGACFLWRPGLLTTHIIADGLIALACGAMALTLMLFARRRAEVRFPWVLASFTAFLVTIGVAELADIWTLWHPNYWVSAAAKGLAGLACTFTAVVFVKLVPQALRIPSPEALQAVNAALAREIEERRRMEQDLRHANVLLEVRVTERTAELEDLNQILVQDNARFAIAADAAGLGFWSHEIPEDVLRWDERMFRLRGLAPSQEEQPGGLWSRSVHPEDRDRCEREVAETLRQNGAYDMEYRVMLANGEIRHLRSVARIARGDDGKAMRMFGVDIDITDLKRAEERFRVAIEAAPTGMLLMGVNGSIALVNAEIESLFGYSREELLGKPIEMLVPQRFRPSHPQFRAEFFGSPQTRRMAAGRDLYGLRRDGSEVPVDIGLTPLHTSAGDFVLASIVDLTMRRELDRMRADFVSMVSHELRTPLTSINGALGLLQKGALGTLPERAAAMAEIAFKNSGRLVRIISDILDIGKLEAGELAIERVSVNITDLLRQAVEVNASYADKYGVRFTLQESSVDCSAIGDPDRLMQVVTNLLSNAAKFSTPGAEVRIRVVEAPGRVRVEVEDSGPGIPESFRSRIFEKFAQADASSTRRFEGTGLGLSIARKLIEGMGGVIGFTSALGQGTTFYFELPRP